MKYQYDPKISIRTYTSSKKPQWIFEIIKHRYTKKNVSHSSENKLKLKAFKKNIGTSS